jgi:hypothetical protein
MKKNEAKSEQKLALFLSNIIIHKTVKFTNEKYYEIILELIRNYGIIKDINYGLEEKMIH